MGSVAEMMAAILAGKAPEWSLYPLGEVGTNEPVAEVEVEIPDDPPRPIALPRYGIDRPLVDNGLVFCDECIHVLESGVCSVAAPFPGARVVAQRGYRPALQPMRCEGFSAIGMRTNNSRNLLPNSGDSRLRGGDEF